MNDGDDLERRLAALFQSAQAPAPSRDFTARAMNAVRQAPLPAGRRPLRSPWAARAGWTAAVAGVAASLLGIAANQPLVGGSIAAMVTSALAFGVWIVQFVGAGAAVFDVFATAGLAIARAAATREGSIGLVLVAIVGAISLSALQKLISEGDRAQWQELSR